MILKECFRTQEDRQVYLSLRRIKQKPVAILFIANPPCNVTTLM